MVLPEFSVFNFRSHKERRVTLAPHTVIVGPNGVGKTNLLEAISVLATTRSFRSSRDSEVVRWGEDVARVTSSDREVAIMVSPTYQKLAKYRGVSLRPLDFLGSLRLVVFTPDSLKIVTGSPADRRRFLDMFLSQADREYARVLADYRRILVQRNSLLKQWNVRAQAPESLETWDLQLATAGAHIVARRREFVQTVNEPLAENYRQLSSGSAPKISLVYQSSGEETSERFLEKLHEVRQREFFARTTLVGPQRDDLHFLFDTYSFADYASRGQIRTLLLALKSVEAARIGTEDTPPILLFDDLFSELDIPHRDAMADVFATYQTVTTTTDVASIPVQLRQDAAIMELSI